ncbi:hypothetical protein FKP32DRAFT_1673921 [Trametes sanguinea]|nr:hypothetical protein FKP32DRAFT_1673921 [Trametes sanguinea]
MSVPSPLDVPPTPTRAQAAFGSKLASLTAQMLQISSELNALSLPSKLPPEVLLNAFLIYAARAQNEHLDRVYKSRGCTDNVPSYFKWILVAHVCHYWREVALSSSEFKAFRVFEAWTMPDDDVPFRLPKEFWTQVPHTVVFHHNMGGYCPRYVGECSYRTGLDHIRQNALHIKHLAIIIEADTDPDELWDSLRQATGTSIESLRIGLRGEAWQYHMSNQESRLTLPEDFFGSCTPRLRSLVTSYVSFSFSNPVLCPSLRHLEITGHQGNLPHQDMEDLMKTLNALPLLQTLVMDCLPTVGESFAELEARLPRLDLLQLTTEFNRAAFFLSHLHFPPTTSLAIHFEGTRYGEGPSLDFIATLRTIVNAAPPRAMSWIISPSVWPDYWERPERSCLRAWAGELLPADDLWVSKPDVPPRLTLTGKTYHSTLAVLESLCLPSLTALHVAGPMPSNEAWARAFVGAPNITLLRVTGRVGFQLGSSLSIAVAGHTSTGNGHSPQACIMPRLQTIQFVRVGFPPPTRTPVTNALFVNVCCEDYEFHHGRWGKRGIDVKDLARGIRRRRELGAAPLELIEFVNCPDMKMTHMQVLLREDILILVDRQALGHSSSDR